MRPRPTWPWCSSACRTPRSPEGADRADMALPAGHNALVERVRREPERGGGAAGRLSRGASRRGPPRAVLLCYLAGCRGGQAAADLLLGRANPSGKLAETWPVRLADTPCAAYFPEKGRQARYRESVLHGLPLLR